jgi:hypothetical protein
MGWRAQCFNCIDVGQSPTKLLFVDLLAHPCERIGRQPVEGCFELATRGEISNADFALHEVDKGPQRVVVFGAQSTSFFCEIPDERFDFLLGILHGALQSFLDTRVFGIRPIFVERSLAE